MLLDTHVLLWLLDGNARLRPQARSAISASPQVLVSSITHTELRIKQMIGKVTLPDGFADLVRRQGLRDLPYTVDHAGAVGSFEELVRHDPFDRMLLAQARFEGVRFCTADSRLLALGLDWLVDATA